MSRPVGVVHFVDSVVFGGSEQALLHLLARLDRRRWKPILFHHAEPGLAPLVTEAARLRLVTRVVPRLQGGRALAHLPRFLRVLRAERAAIFHAHLNWLLSCKFGLLAAALVRMPAVVATLQQFLLPPWRANISWQQRLVAVGVDRYIAVSDAVARQLSEDFRVPQHKITTVPNSIPLISFDRAADPALRDALSRGGAGALVLTVARLDEQKGHRYLLEAICQISGAVFVLAGSGPEQTSLEARAHALGVADRVRFLGHRTDVPDLLASCDLFVLPSLYEGLPLSVLEAMAAGKAVVATAVGGTPEVVLDGVTGVLVPPRDPRALADAVRSLLSDSALTKAMGAAGRARVHEQFGVETMVRRVGDIYEALLSRREAARGPR